MKPVWLPGERVEVRLPLPGFATVFWLLCGALAVGAYLWAMSGMSRAQVDSGIWVPGFLASLAGGLGGGFAVARAVFGSWLTLDWGTRVATVRGRRARSFSFDLITGVTAEVTFERGRHHRYLAGRILLTTASERLLVRFRTGPREGREELEKEVSKEARQLARALGRKFKSL